MRLTPPRVVVFLLSLVLAGLSVASHYTHIPSIQHVVVAHRYWMVVAAYVILAAGVLLPGL